MLYVLLLICSNFQGFFSSSLLSALVIESLVVTISSGILKFIRLVLLQTLLYMFTMIPLILTVRFQRKTPYF